MAGIMDYLGKGAMPHFDMRGGGSSVPFADISSQAAATTAAGIDMRDQMANKFSSDSDAFSDGLDYLKDLMSPEDQEEELLEDLPLEAIAPMMGPSGDDEATGKFTPSYDVEPSFLEKTVEGGKGLFGKTVDYVKENPIESALTAGSFFNLPLAAIMGGYYLGGGDEPIPTPEDAVEYGNFEEGNLGVAMDKSGFFDKGSIQRQRELNDALENPDADLPSWYDEMDHEGSMAGVYDTREFAEGGRVNLNTGGLTYGYTPFMNAQQGLNYYNQFAAPDYGITGIADQADEAVEDAQEEATVVNETLGTTLFDRGGPEDRGSYSDRFGTAEDQGYGYSGVPGEGGSATFNNPAYGSSLLGTGTGDTFTPAGTTVNPDGSITPGLGMAYDEYGRLRDIGVLNDIGLNMYNFAYPIAKMKPGIPGIFENMINANKKYNEKKAQEEREAQAQKVKDDAAALQADIKKQFEEREQKKKDKEEREAKAAQTLGTGFKTAKAADTATGKFSGSPKGDGPKGGFGGPSGHGSGKQGGKHGAAGGQGGKNKGTSRF